MIITDTFKYSAIILRFEDILYKKIALSCNIDPSEPAYSFRTIEASESIIIKSTLYSMI